MLQLPVHDKQDGNGTRPAKGASAQQGISVRRRPAPRARRPSSCQAASDRLLRTRERRQNRRLHSRKVQGLWLGPGPGMARSVSGGAPPPSRAPEDPFKTLRRKHLRDPPLSAGASAPPPASNQGPGGSLPGPDAGHPLHGAGGCRAVAGQLHGLVCRDPQLDKLRP
jgi:hypothetical protein